MTQHDTLRAAFLRGERLTVAEALTRYGVYALSQRCGEMPDVRSEWYTPPSGKRVKRYYIPQAGEQLELVA